MKIKRIMTSFGIVVVGVMVLNLVLTPVDGEAGRRQRVNRSRRIITFGLLAPRLLRALDLTTEQETKIQELKDSFKEARKALFEDIIPAHRAVQAELFGPDPVSEEDVASQMAQIIEYIENYRRDGLKIALELREVLTPEQLDKALEIIERRRELRGEVRSLYQGNQ